jgi:hypothetical protein
VNWQRLRREREARLMSALELFFSSCLSVVGLLCVVSRCVDVPGITL